MKLRNSRGKKSSPGNNTNSNNPGNTNTTGGIFASAISACWNNTSTTTINSNSNSAGSTNSLRGAAAPTVNATSGSSSSSSLSISSMNGNKTTCLFCPNVVMLNNDGGGPHAHNGKLHQLLINLCNHLEISNEEIPSEQCSKIRFPFCTSCEAMVVDLWKQQQLWEALMLKIEKIVGDLEHVVVDGEILGNMGKAPGSSYMARMEQQKFTRLRELILEGYRNKLVRRHQQDNAPNENEAEGNFNRANSPSTMKQEHYEQVEEYTISNETMDMDFENAVADDDDEFDEDDDLPPPLTRQNIPDLYDDQEEQELEQQSYSADTPEGDGNIQWSVDPGVVARYNDANCTMVITNENDETDETSLIQIKQEARASANQYDDDSEEEDNDDIFTLAERKRRFLFEGVEIYRANGTGVRAKMDYLQCSLCSYTLPIKKYNTCKASSPFMKMKTHILHIHKQKSGLPKAPRAREHSCIPCEEKFATAQQLRAHKATHPADGTYSCNICGKPFKKGSSQYNLLIHRFSHKNDVERQAALAAGERGAYNSMLTTKLDMAYLAGRGRSVPRKRTGNSNANATTTRPVVPVTNRASTSSTSANGKSIKCQVCKRNFGRKCHLMRHMYSAHSDAGPSSSSSTNRNRGVARRRTVGNVTSTSRPRPPTLAPQLRVVPPRTSTSTRGGGTGGPTSQGVVTPSNTGVSLQRGGQRVALGDGTVVVVKQEILDLLMNNN